MRVVCRSLGCLRGADGGVSLVGQHLVITWRIGITRCHARRGPGCAAIGNRMNSRLRLQFVRSGILAVLVVGNAAADFFFPRGEEICVR